MPAMVYIRQLFPQSFLHFSPNGEGFALRDYSAPGQGEATIVRRQAAPEWTATRIRELANQAGNHFMMVPEVPVREYQHWHEETQRLNKQYLKEERKPPERLLEQPRSWLREIIIGVVVTVLAAAILAWLGLSK